MSGYVIIDRLRMWSGPKYSMRVIRTSGSTLDLTLKLYHLEPGP